MNSWSLTIGVLLAIAFAGCDDVPKHDKMFPLGDGRTWTYHVITDYEGLKPVSTEMTITSHGADNLSGEKAWRRRADTGFNYWIKSDPSGVFRVASKHALDLKVVLDDEPRYVLKQPYVKGTKWSANTTSYMLQRRNEVPKRVSTTHKSFIMNYRIEKTDVQLETPAGKFDGCLEVVGISKLYLWVDLEFGFRNMPLTTREWYCPDVGLVRLERLEPSPSRFMIGGKKTFELIDWQ
ncbi:MAG: hypothetical protein ACRBCJ_09865 [Hyphomicrobiaceae bacterium]